MLFYLTSFPLQYKENKEIQISSLMTETSITKQETNPKITTYFYCLKNAMLFNTTKCYLHLQICRAKFRENQKMKWRTDVLWQQKNILSHNIICEILKCFLRNISQGNKNVAKKFNQSQKLRINLPLVSDFNSGLGNETCVCETYYSTLS